MELHCWDPHRGKERLETSPPCGRLVIYYSQYITITIAFENIQSITITFKNFKSITITITLASITSITFYYIRLQFGANLRCNFNTEIKLTGYFTSNFTENASDYATQG